MEINKMEKKGVFFSTDALIALMIIFFMVLIATPILLTRERISNVHRDILVTLSSLEAGELEGAPSYLITDPNKTILEQIGEFYAMGNIDAARELADYALQDVETNENIGLWYENTLIWSRSTIPFDEAENIDTSRQIITGLVNGTNVTGFSARAFLQEKVKTQYFYFGGYVGDGNITAVVEYNGEIKSAAMEIAINDNFGLFVNNVSQGNYQKSASDFQPINYTIPITNFQSGLNFVEYRGNNLHIAGGFIKIVYESNVTYQQPKKYYFPAINGLINIYDGFYIPKTLTSMNINLDLESNLTTFLNIGNVTVFNGTTNGRQTISLSNANLLSILGNYNDIVNKTVPLRLGLENVSYITNISLDLISLFDATQVMKSSLSKLKEAHYLLIDEVLKFSNSRMGMIGYRPTVPASLFHALSNNIASLENLVNNWVTTDFVSQNRDLCKGIDTAVNDFTTNPGVGNPIRIAIIMSAGGFTHCGGATPNAGPLAVQKACEAHSNYGIKFYTVGFGNNSDVQTLQAIANCGEGNFYFSDLQSLPELYKIIIGDIILKYSLQTADISTTNVNTKLYPGSYIEFDYPQTAPQSGLLITLEKSFSNDTSGNFEIAVGSSIVQSNVISYSGPRWTSLITLNGNVIYNLSRYGSDFLQLGDPYSISIPNQLVLPTGTNQIYLQTGVTPANSSAGSTANKIIYTVAKNVSAFSPIAIGANGCMWDIEFEDSTTITNANIPSTYNGTEQCYYNTANGKIYNTNDAAQTATFIILEQLDFNNNNKIDVPFAQQDLEIILSQVVGIPFSWSTEVQTRIWS